MIIWIHLSEMGLPPTTTTSTIKMPQESLLHNAYGSNFQFATQIPRTPDYMIDNLDLSEMDLPPTPTISTITMPQESLNQDGYGDNFS